MTQPSRPPFVLAILADQQGCGFHRIMTPLGSLVEAGVADGRMDLMVWPDHVAVAAKPDVIIWQRQVEDGQIEAMARWRTLLPNTLFVYELDDYLGEIPEASFHASFMPPDIEDRIGRALQYCDRATTTTASLAAWLKGLGAKDVRVVPNALPQARLKGRTASPAGKLRIGFAGGMSHSGDLELIKPAMLAIGDAVTWVFMGTKPDGLRSDFPVEFHEGVAATSYLDVMGTLDLDLMLAPLETNEFNRCKSNLRLVEAGAIGASVIAQDLLPYHADKPPVFAYATTPETWTAAIQKFIATKASVRQHDADALRTWVGRHYTLERRLKERVEAWLPEAVQFRPDTPRPQTAPLVVSCPDADLDERMPFLRKARKVGDGLVYACHQAVLRGAGVLWLRPATTMSEQSWDSIQAVAAVPSIASVVPLASDGSSGFPVADQWSPVPPAAVLLLSRVLHEVMPGRQLSLRAPSGPAVLLTAAALSMLGAPDVDGCDGNEEHAIVEWGLRASMRQWKHMQAVDAYAASLAPPAQPSQQALLRLQARGYAQHVQAPVETLTDLEREDIELRMLRGHWTGPRPGSMGFGNDYNSWFDLYQVQNPISGLPEIPARAVVRSFGSDETWPGDAWVIFTDSNTTLASGFSILFDAAIADVDEAVCVIYADHEGRIGTSRLPEFKPDFDRELFFAQDYVTQICAVRGSWIGQAPADRLELYSRILDVAVLPEPQTCIAHLPRLLATVAYADTPERMALDAFSRQLALQEVLGDSATVVPHKHVLGCLQVVHDWKPGWSEAPLVSIIIPTLGSSRLIQPCIATILQHTAYPNFEIIIVQNGDRREPELNSAIRNDPRVTVVYWPGSGFNWSALNNFAIRQFASGDYIVTMNDDVNVATKGWLDAMMGQATYPDAGVVGARLLHPAGFIQHVGVICHRGIAGHMHKMLPNGQAGHLGRAMLSHEASAVTGACMLFSRILFEDIGGFDEGLAHNYNDTAFCLAAHQRGRRNIVEMTAELLHPEGTSRQSPFSAAGARKLIEEGRLLAQLCPGDDPYWNPLLALGIVTGGVGIQGLGADMLAWSDFQAGPDAQRVLLINDLPGSAGLTLDVLDDGGIPMAADLSGFHLRLTGPNALNVKPWDVRDPERMNDSLCTLGIDRIVLRSLVGRAGAAPPVESLRCFAQLGIHVDLLAIDQAYLAPWLAAMPSNNNLFGFVNIAAWKEAYEQLAAIPDNLAAE